MFFSVERQIVIRCWNIKKCLPTNFFPCNIRSFPWFFAPVIRRITLTCCFQLKLSLVFPHNIWMFVDRQYWEIVFTKSVYKIRHSKVPAWLPKKHRGDKRESGFSNMVSPEANSRWKCIDPLPWWINKHSINSFYTSAHYKILPFNWKKSIC